jgi:GT2 family glycosyltransferase
VSTGPPDVSIVVLTHDRPRALTRCLASIAAQRTVASWEVIVADDGSGPATAHVVDDARRADPRVRHVRHEHQGIAATRNLGVSAAHGRFVAIVADDYVLAPEYLDVALDYLARRPDAAVVRFDIRPLRSNLGSRVSDCYYSASLARRLESEGYRLDEAVIGVPTTTLEAAGAAVFRAEVLAGVGGWDEQFQRGEDTEFTARLRDAGFSVHVLYAGTVRHDYRAVPIDTLRKAFLVGWWRRRVAAWTQPRSAPMKALTLGRALDRARRGGRSTAEVVLYVPWMVLFEMAIAAGHISDLFAHRAWGRAGRTPAAAGATSRR